MKPLAIAHANLLRLSRDRMALFLTFLLPLVLILLLGLVFGSPSLTRIGVLVEDRGALGEDFVRRLAAFDDLSVHRYSDESTLAARVERSRLVAGVVVPADYTERLSAGLPAEVLFIAEDNQYTPAVRANIAAALDDQGVEVRAARFAARIDALPFEQALAAARDLRPRAATVDVQVTTPGEEEGLRPWGQYELVASQELLLMVFLVSLQAASHLMLSRQLGVSRRMMATPTPMAVILAGEGLGRFAIAIVQSLFIVVVTGLLFGVRWGDPLAAGAIVAAFALVGTGAAMLIGAFVKTEAQATAIALSVALVVAAVGGCMQPLQTFPDVMRTAAHITPHAWALDAFEQVIRGSGGVGDILRELGVLAGFAAALLALATWSLRRSIHG